ncbi:hypothetical protein [Dyella sp.]|uniref:hypothetical protein n=1 Tax=Dyella sp. TaxID=1869338 RepID=UPI002ED44AD3
MIVQTSLRKFRASHQLSTGEMNLIAKFAGLAMTLWMATSASASTIGVSSPHAGESLLLGSWLLDTSRLPMPPDQRPKSVKFSFDDAGAGRWNVHVDIVYAPGQEVHSVAIASLDGSSAQIDRSPEADHVQLKQPAPNVLVMALHKDGTLVSTRIYSVTPDGNNLVETAVYPGQNGMAVMKSAYFKRAH